MAVVAALVGLIVWGVREIEVSRQGVPHNAIPMPADKMGSTLVVDEANLPLADHAGPIPRHLKLIPGEEPVALAAADAAFDLGIACYRQRDKEGARRCWERALDLRPGNVEAHYNLALALKDAGNLTEAIGHYRRVVQLKPDFPEAQAGLGAALGAQGAFQKGLPHLSQAVDLDPADPTIRYNFALILAQRQQYDRAITHLRQVVGLDPSHTDALLCLALCYTQTHQIDQTLRTLEESLRIARQIGREALAARIMQQIQFYRRSTLRAGNR